MRNQHTSHQILFARTDQSVSSSPDDDGGGGGGATAAVVNVNSGVSGGSGLPARSRTSKARTIMIDPNSWLPMHVWGEIFHGDHQ